MSKNISLIENIENTESIENVEEKENEKKTADDFRKGAIDLFLPLEKRLKYLFSYYQLEKEAVGELISCIIGMYFFSKTKNLTEYLNAICPYTSLPIHYRIECAKNVDKGYHHINKMFIEEEKDIKQLPTPIRVETVMFLMSTPTYREESREYFCNILADHTIDELYRFRIIQSLENKFSTTADRETFIFYAKESSIRFMKNTKNTFSYRVLACQYLLEKCDPDENLIKTIETFLLEVAENPIINDDIRADACDVLLQYGSDASRESARALLFILGGGDIARNNIFKNAQNVHIRSIEESVEKIIEKLASYYPLNGGKVYDFSKTRDEIITKISDHKEEIEGALTRILIDRAVYGKTNMTLSTILSKVWTYIQDSQYREELEKRLLEELTESNNKCSTGYVSRLVNTLSGFDENMSITISFEDQIIANLEGRLNAKIKDIEDEDKMDLILHEMTIPVLFYHLRGNFLSFFRENISIIREEMYQEFCKFMSDTDYDMNFRKAIMHYEGVY